MFSIQWLFEANCFSHQASPHISSPPPNFIGTFRPGRPDLYTWLLEISQLLRAGRLCMTGTRAGPLMEKRFAPYTRAAFVGCAPEASPPHPPSPLPPPSSLPSYSLSVVYTYICIYTHLYTLRCVCVYDPAAVGPSGCVRELLLSYLEARGAFLISLGPEVLG